MGFFSPLAVTLENKNGTAETLFPKTERKIQEENGTNWVTGQNEMVQSCCKEEKSTGKETRKRKEARPAKDWKCKLGKER